MEEAISATPFESLTEIRWLQNVSTLNSSGLSANGTVISATQTSPVLTSILTLFYIIGIVGNLAAIIALRRGNRRLQNRKHLLMLTTLAANDLVALIGMMAMMITQNLSPWVERTKCFCAMRVVMRIFGIGSVGITVIMALERLLALTRPFLYQKQVTYHKIRMALLVSWSWAAVLTLMPLAGLGVYYDPKPSTGKSYCLRYRNAQSNGDIAYAAFFVAFGTLLCVVLVYCNLMVIKALYSISAPKSQDRLAVRRFSKNSSKRARTPVTWRDQSYNTATAEEVAFSKLMATLSVLFMICWLPQMVTSALYLAVPSTSWERYDKPARFSDVMMLLNYVLDPYLYVLLRRNRYSLKRCLADLCNKGMFWQSHKSSTESIKTSATCCPQDSLLSSDHGSELRVVPSKTTAAAADRHRDDRALDNADIVML